MDRATKKRKILNLNLLKDDGQKKRFKKNKGAKEKPVKKPREKHPEDTGDASKLPEDFTDNSVLVEDTNEGEDVSSVSTSVYVPIPRIIR